MHVVHVLPQVAAKKAVSNKAKPTAAPAAPAPAATEAGTTALDATATATAATAGSPAAGLEGLAGVLTGNGEEAAQPAACDAGAATAAPNPETVPTGAAGGMGPGARKEAREGAGAAVAVAAVVDQEDDDNEDLEIEVEEGVGERAAPTPGKVRACFSLWLQHMHKHGMQQLATERIVAL